MVSFGKKSGIKFLKKLGLMMCIIPAKQKRIPNRILKKSTVVCMSVYGFTETLLYKYLSIKYTILAIDALPNSSSRLLTLSKVSLLV